jgi:hypothetical protein
VGEVITDLGKHSRGGDRDDMIAEQVRLYWFNENKKM